MKDITPYSYTKLIDNTFVISYYEEILLTMENSKEDNVIKTTNLLNGAFREGVIFGNFNKIEELQ